MAPSSFYHPILFSVISVVAIIELGLVSYERRQQHDFPIDGQAVTGRIDYLIFTSVWTTVTGLLYLFLAKTSKFGIIASHGAHLFWLFWTWIMWLLAAALYQSRLNQNSCGETARRCHINHTVEGFAWMEMSFTFIGIFLVIFHVGSKTERYRTGPYDV